MSLRVVHIVSSLKMGGMENFALRLAGRQQSLGHRASVIALQGGPLQDAAGRSGIDVITLGGKSRVIRVLKAMAALTRLKPDIVHGHNPTSLQYAALAKRCTRARVVITCHGRGKADHREPPVGLWRSVDAVVCVSDAVASETPASISPDRLKVIRNGVDPAPAGAGREALRASLNVGNATVGIIVARIDHLKGHETLLRAWARTEAPEIPAILLVVGDGPERAAMEGLATDLCIADRVRFLGFRSDVNDLLAASDLFLLPSLTEGLPLSILEAMAHGLPIVATHVGGIPELVTHEQEGLLVEPRDVPGLAAAIKRVGCCPDLRATLGRSALRRACADFSFDAMLRQYDALYRSLHL